MNPDIQILQTVPTETAASPSHQGVLEPDDPLQHPAFGNGPRGNGKIARLPKILRDQVNHWLLDGVSYPQIIERLGDQGKDLNPGHLCEWKKRGYHDWLLQREWLEQISSKTDFSSDILASGDSTGLHEAGLRFAASQMLDQLMRFGAASQAQPNSAGEPEKFARLVNALSRLTREALAFQKYRDQAALAKANQLDNLDVNRTLAEKERDLALGGVEKFLGFRPGKPIGPSHAEFFAAQGIVPLNVPQPSNRSSRGDEAPIKEEPTPLPFADASPKPPPDRSSRGDEAPIKEELTPPHVADASPIAPPDIQSAQQSNIKIQNSKIPVRERCQFCRADLPPLLPDGQRPFTHCQTCQTALRPPHLLHRYCPECAGRLADNDEALQSLKRCPTCAFALPPPTPNAAAG